MDRHILDNCRDSSSSTLAASHRRHVSERAVTRKSMAMICDIVLHRWHLETAVANRQVDILSVLRLLRERGDVIADQLISQSYGHWLSLRQRRALLVITSSTEHRS
jgi:hypothetical protein